MRTATGTDSRPSRQEGPNLAPLRLIPGGRNKPAYVFVELAAHDELHLELLSARAERTVFASRVHALVRSAARHLASGHPAAAGTSLMEIERLTVQEADRVLAMDAAACACGVTGIGHGAADDAVLAVPAAEVA